MGFWSKFVGFLGIIAAPFTGGLSLIATGLAVVAPKLVDKVFDSVIGFVLQPFMGLLGGNSDTSAAEAERQQGILVTRRGGGSESIPVIYGLRRVGGIITFAETGSTNNKYLWVAYVFSEGCVEGVYDVAIDDVSLPDPLIIGALNAGQTIQVTSGKYAGRVEMRWSPGNGVNDSGFWSKLLSNLLGFELKAYLFKDSPSFKSSMMYNGLATMFVRYEWKEIKTQEDANANPFNGSIPDLTLTIMGRKVASLTTTDSENANYGETGYAERYSTNPAEILLDYLRNPRYGKGLKNSEIDWASFRTAAAKCNTDVTYTSGGTRGPIMTTNYVLSTNYTIFDNVKFLLQGFRAYLPYVQGKYKLKIEDAGHPTDITSGEATIIAECVATPNILDGSYVSNTYEIMGQVQYSGIDRSAKYNQVVVTYVDPDNKWSNQQVVYPATEEERQTYITQDGGRENKLEATFPTITNYAMAYDFARLLFNKSRYQETCSLRVSSHAFELEPGDNIRIKSKMLNFYDTPWRVINITYNNDYTFSISCVRNPDFMYPYTRAGEVDRVNPIYVPKGLDIYAPVNAYNISLLPPTRSTYITSVVGNGPGTVILPTGATATSSTTYTLGNTTVNITRLNPISTVTTGNTGGGVGGNVGAINTNPVSNIPVVPIQQIVDAMSDTVDFSNVEYVAKNGLTYARITFRQPSNTQYAGLLIFYKSGNSGYIQYNEPTVKGPNQEIIFDLGPLAVSSVVSTVYDVIVRVKYIQDQLSTKFTRTQLTPVLGTTVNPTEVVQVSNTAWPTTTTVTSGPVLRDTRIESIGATIAGVGSAGSARTIALSLIQDIRTQAANFDVNGVRIYWKPSTDTYYSTTKVVFSNYSPGNSVALPFTGDIGVVGGPTSYDFVFRLTYIDNTDSSYYYVRTFGVEKPASASYPYNAAYGASGSSPLVSTYTVITTDQAPPGTVASALDTKLGIGGNAAGVNFLKNTSNQTGMRFYLDPPAVANRATWRGVKIRYRPVIAGTNPALVEYSNPSVSLASLTGLSYHEVWGMLFDQKYQIIITPQVVSGGVTQDSNYSLFGTGYVHDRSAAADYPATGNWTPSFGFVQMDTKTALGTTGQAFAAGNPTLDIISMNIYSLPTGTGTSGYSKVSSTVAARTQYVRLVYNGDKASGLTKLYIYRRSRTTLFGTTGWSTLGVTNAMHYGVGRWERVEVTHSGTGNKIVNLRMPTNYTEFDRYYGISVASTTLTRAPVGEAAGTVPITVDTANTDWLIVAVVSTTESNQAHYIRGKAISTGFTNVDLINPTRPTPITWASESTIADASYTLTYQRKISEARTTLVPIANFDYYAARQLTGNATPTQTLGVTSISPQDGPAIV